MTPRRYDMRARAASVEQTRRRIVSEAIRLFASKTAASTNMDDIARAAEVSLATVYRHFGDFDTLADACAQTAFAIAEIPTPQQAALQFADLPDLPSKFRRFVDLSCHCYERASDWLAAERRERHLPAFAKTLAREEAMLDAIVRGLLKPVRPPETTISVVKALVDFSFWEALIAAGLPPARVAPAMHNLVMHQLGSAGLAQNSHPSEAKRGSHARNRS